jgi:transposase
MPAIKYVIDLTDAEREQLKEVTRRGSSPARKLKRAMILLKADEGSDDEQVARMLDVGIATVGRIRKRFVEEGLDASLSERPRSGRPAEIGGKQQAHIIALACSQPPDGHARWSMRLLAQRAVELEIVESISHERVRTLLKKTISSRGRKSSGAFPGWEPSL